MSLRKKYTVARFKEQVIESLLIVCALISIATTLGIILVLFTESVYSFTGERAFFQQVSPMEFFFGTQWSPQFAEPNKHFGILPLLCGTVLVAGVAALTGLPAGILAAIYLSEYASSKVRKIVKPFLEILAGIPTVVYGYFALQFVTPYLIVPFFHNLLGLDVEGFNALSAGIVVGIMVFPMVCSLSEDALRAVPRSLREAGYALGSTKYDVSVKVVVPAATSGIIASFLLAVSRAIGETMAVVIAAGQSPAITLNPLQSIQTMTGFMVNISMGDTAAGSIEYKSLYAVGLTLFCMTLLMNILSQWWMRRFREVYQ
ncbi:phosphate ABC transporter permease subunit PstC [Planctomicrobium sp. SH668]|uniref:phosphate ABC transporter permease subunit PstC n=1 Tax=Planctomicrobium sp. SH668 TaxID=3448126 RepID=UPI003F5C6153